MATKAKRDIPFVPSSRCGGRDLMTPSSEAGIRPCASRTRRQEAARRVPQTGGLTLAAMSTDTSGTQNGVERTVEREYTISVFPGDHDVVSEILDVDPQYGDSETKAMRRSFADWLTSLVDGRSLYDTTTNVNETYIIEVGDTDVEVGSRQTDLYKELMQAAANYNGQHPLGFRTDEEEETTYSRSPSAAFRRSVQDELLDEFDQTVQPSDDTPELRNTRTAKWEAPGDIEVSLTMGYNSIRAKPHPTIEMDDDVPCVHIGVSITAATEDVVDMLDAWVYNQVEESFDSLLGARRFVFERSGETTEVTETE